MEFDKVKDSGKRQEFNTGSVRDTAEGKGMPHLIGGESLFKVLNWYKVCNVWHIGNNLKNIESYLLHYNTVGLLREENLIDLYHATILIIGYINNQEGTTYSGAFKRLAKHYENGAKKYSKNNWRRGQPISRYYDSTMRHLWATFDGNVEEDHPAAIFWNLIAIIQTKLDVSKGFLPEELDDFPFTIGEVFPKIENKQEE